MANINTILATARQPLSGRVTLLNVLARMDAVLPGLREVVKARTRDGAVVRLDGKAGCELGPWGNNSNGALQTNAFDPGWCARDRDRIMPPVLRMSGMSCTDVDDLFWADIYEVCKRTLGIALSARPDPSGAWTIQAKWTRQVMELVSMALEATNIQPIFLFPAKWSTERAWRSRNADGFEMDWGLYTTGYTREGSTAKTVNGCVPKAVLDYVEQSVAAARRARPGVAIYQPYSAIHWDREQMGLWTVPVFTPAMCNGSCFTLHTQSVKALQQGEHDPWRTWGNTGEATVLSDGMLDRKGARVGASTSAVMAAQMSYAGSVEKYFLDLFLTTGRTPRGFAQGWDPRTRAVSYIPNGMWWVDLAATWASEIVARDFFTIITDSSLFYLINHNTYFKRIYGDQTSLSTEQSRELAEGLRAARTDMATIGATVGAQLVSLINPLAGAVIAQLSSVVSDEMTRVYHFPELPKSLFRRVPSRSDCGLDPGWGGGLDRAAANIADRVASRGAQDALSTLSSDGRASVVKPLLIGGALAAVVAGGWYLLKE